MTYSRLTRSFGFTLIEILVVVAILGLLATIVLTFVGAARNEAKSKAVNAEFGQFRTQMEINSGGNPWYAGACDGQAIKNIVNSLKNLTNSEADCYPGDGLIMNSDPDNDDGISACGCRGNTDWTFWINLGEYDDSGGQDLFTCLNSSGEFTKIDALLIQGGGVPACSG